MIPCLDVRRESDKGRCMESELCVCGGGREGEGGGEGCGWGEGGLGMKGIYLGNFGDSF